MWGSVMLFSLVTLLFQNSFGMSPDWPQSCRKATLIARKEWGARIQIAVDYGAVPTPNVVIHHTVTPECTTQESCSATMRSIQNFHMDTMEFHDIGYNFVIGGDGQVYEGAGWHKIGAHTRGYNSRSIGIGLVGNYNDKLPNAKMLQALSNFLQCGVDLGELTADYKLFAARQVSATLSPGAKFYDQLKKWPHFSASP